MKRTILKSIVLTLAIVLSLAGCGNAKQEPQPADTTSVEETLKEEVKAETHTKILLELQGVNGFQDFTIGSMRLSAVHKLYSDAAPLLQKILDEKEDYVFDEEELASVRELLRFSRYLLAHVPDIAEAQTDEVSAAYLGVIDESQRVKGILVYEFAEDMPFSDSQIAVTNNIGAHFGMHHIVRDNCVIAVFDQFLMEHNLTFEELEKAIAKIDVSEA